MWPFSRKKPQPQTVMLTLGRTPVALEIARCLHAVGFRVVVVDPFRNHICKHSKAVAKSFKVTAPDTDCEAYLSEVTGIIERENVQLVIPVSEEVLYVAELKDRLEGKVRVLCEKARTLHTFHDKLKFARMAKTLGLSAPDTFPEDSDEGRELIENDDYVIKPAHGCAGIGVQVCRDGASHDDSSESMLVQRYVAGDHISSLSLLNKGREIATVLYRASVRAGGVAVCVERVDYAPTVRKWVSRFCEKIPYTGFVSFDFIVDGQGTPWAIECNPRASSGLHFLDPKDLARAILKPGSTRRVETRPDSGLKWGLPTLVQTLLAIVSPDAFKRRLGSFTGSSNILWSPTDPWPSLMSIPSTREIWWPALREGMTLGEAMHQDVAVFSTTSDIAPRMSKAPGEKLAVVDAEPKQRPAPENKGEPEAAVG